MTIIHMTSEQVEQLSDVFAYAVELSDGSLGWMLPGWLISLRQTVLQQ